MKNMSMFQKRSLEIKPVTVKKKTVLLQSNKQKQSASEIKLSFAYECNNLTGQIEWYGNIGERLGYSYAEFPETLEKWEEIIHFDDLGGLTSSIQHHLETDEPYFAKYRVRRKNGVFTYVSDCGTTLWNGSGIPYKRVGVLILHI